ncbi:MAG: SDR family NAD(P)-dependent oxidoreductase, partial [Kiloniellales bacterium]|nr:SDR family NAD(P)-dependent oxidoreductase [Kiloniellales bacterium]
MDKTLLCFGMGYSAEVLAGRLAAEGWRIKGTSQGSEKAEALRKRGFDIRILSTDTPLSDARAY